jgi:hypothetical protein
MMRLLKREDDGKFNLIEFIGKDIPRYAILSHTWGPDNEEVSFKDITEDAGKGKAGYAKIHFCAKQAARDALQFFWVDTCCIDKSSSAEVSEAINSMYRWYHEAAKCYVYLSDVSIALSHSDGLVKRALPKPGIERSRWFTRGWTLQELIAPAFVQFFSVEGELLGDKQCLEDLLYGITGISVEALRGADLTQFTIDERMSWTTGRETKREEDAAYCLLGIFSVHMPLIYGEGEKRARKRLRREIFDQLEDDDDALKSSEGAYFGHSEATFWLTSQLLSPLDCAIRPKSEFHRPGDSAGKTQRHGVCEAPNHKDSRHGTRRGGQDTDSAQINPPNKRAKQKLCGHLDPSH